MTEGGFFFDRFGWRGVAGWDCFFPCGAEEGGF